MSAKRQAASELNADNWDKVDEPEEEGNFRVASNEDLQRRVIRTAKRRSNLVSGDETKKGIFSSFGGFGKAPSSSASPFSFLSNVVPSQPTTEIAKGNAENRKADQIKPMEVVKLKNQEEKASQPSHSDEYCANLKNLNLSVSEWIKSHIEKNPYCILTPIFEDYKKHLKEIDKYKVQIDKSNTDKEESKLTEVLKTNKKDIAPSSTSLFSQTKVIDTPKTADKLETSKFTSPSNSLFSQGFSSTPVSKAPLFSFGQNTSTTTPASNFSFGTGKPFSFGNIIPEETKPTSKPEETKPISKPEDENEEDEEPPKTTFTPVVEEDNVFSKRCKVFVKNDGTFGDRGVGTLYLKPISDSEKFQLIVRADTNLGNLLINMVLSQAIPTKRIGKNNVMIVTIPTPEAKPPPVPVLLRVKTSEEADELLEILDKYKK